MRWVILLGWCVACTPHASPVVNIASPAADDRTPPIDATLLGDCRIVGTGERAREHDDGAPFDVFESLESRGPMFVIAHPERAHVMWSHFPTRADDGRTRARVELGGQGIRGAGFAGLYGRTFTTTKRMDSVAGHLWARAGAAVDVMNATAGGDIYARVSTPFAAPKTIVVHGNCADLRYTPDVPAHAQPALDVTAMSHATSFPIFAEPASARPFTTITVAANEAISFQVLDHRDDVVRVVAHEDDVSLDAWVRATDIETISGRGVLRAPHGSRSIDNRSTLPRARVMRDTPLVVGFEPAPSSALVEKGTLVVVDESSATTASGIEVVAFDLEDGFIVAPENEHLWIARSALALVR